MALIKERNLNMNIARLLPLILYCIPFFSFAHESILCVDGYDNYSSVVQAHIPTYQPNMKFSYPTEVIPLKEATTGGGLSWWELIRCGITSDHKIDGYKGDDGQMHFDITWAPLIKNINPLYVDNVAVGLFAGDGWMPSAGVHGAKSRIFAKTQTRATKIRFKKGIHFIPSGTHLFDYHLYFKLKLDGTGDPTYRTSIPVVTDKNYFIEEPTCDFSSPNVNLTLDDYERNTNTKKLVPLSIKCNFDYNLNITLRALVSGQDSSIFANTATIDPAKGVGFRFTDLNGNTIMPFKKYQYYSLYNENTYLFYVDYARTGEKLRAGNAQSVIGVELEYD